MRLKFSFAGLHSDAPDLSGDLALLYRLVAEKFEVAVGDALLYRETEFPVVELASAFDHWLGGDGAHRRSFTFEPTGYAYPGALQFRPHDGSWIIDSSRRVAGAVPQQVEISELEGSVRGYLDDVASACAAVGVDLHALLGRLQHYAAEHRTQGRLSTEH